MENYYNCTFSAQKEVLENVNLQIFLGN